MPSSCWQIGKCARQAVLSPCTSRCAGCNYSMTVQVSPAGDNVQTTQHDVDVQWQNLDRWYVEEGRHGSLPFVHRTCTLLAVGIAQAEASAVRQQQTPY